MEVQKEDMRMGHYVQRRVSFIHGLLLMMKKENVFMWVKEEKSMMEQNRLSFVK